MNSGPQTFSPNRSKNSPSRAPEAELVGDVEVHAHTLQVVEVLIEMPAGIGA